MIRNHAGKSHRTDCWTLCIVYPGWEDRQYYGTCAALKARMEGAVMTIDGGPEIGCHTWRAPRFRMPEGATVHAVSPTGKVFPYTPKPLVNEFIIDRMVKL